MSAIPNPGWDNVWFGVNGPNHPTFQKRNQHYVPRFWQKRFADGNGQVYARYRKDADPHSKPQGRGVARPVSVAHTMTQDYTYTIFDPQWRPTDALEDLISKADSRISVVNDQILDAKTVMTTGLRQEFGWGLALAACRLPHVMRRAHRRRIELAQAYSQIGNMDQQTFERMLLEQFGLPISKADYEALRSRPADALVKTARALADLSPQDPNFPGAGRSRRRERRSGNHQSNGSRNPGRGSAAILYPWCYPIPDYDLALRLHHPVGENGSLFKRSLRQPPHSTHAVRQRPRRWLTSTSASTTTA